MPKTIPQLTDATTVNAADELIIQQGGVTKRATVAELTTASTGINNVKAFGAVGNGVHDDTAAIQAAVAANESLHWPAGVYRITSTITCSSAQTWTALGEVTIKYDASVGSPAAPAIDFVGEVFLSGDFVIDHCAHTNNYTAPVVYGGNTIAGSAVLVQGDYSTVANIIVQNAWDNGVAVVKLHPSTGVVSTGLPKYCSISGIRSYGCGVGDRAGGKVGAGVNIASAQACTLSDCVDLESYNGFIVDLGAGAQVTASNCIAWNTQRDGANPNNGSGYGFYVGAADCMFVNCYSVFSQYRGWWYDGTASNCEFVNCGSSTSQYEGLYIKGGSAQLTNFRIKNASSVGASVADAALIDSSGGTIKSLRLQLHTTGSLHRYGLNATGANLINGYVTGILNGSTAEANISGRDLATYLQYDASGGGIKHAINVLSPGATFEVKGTMRAIGATANQSYLVQPFGDTQGNGTFTIQDSATAGKRAAFGYDPVNDCFVMQSIDAGVANKPMFINPSGGDVMAGAGTWNGGRLRLGANYLWVDGSNRLRIKSSVPTSDTDGTVVGTQS